MCRKAWEFESPLPHQPVQSTWTATECNATYPALLTRPEAVSPAPVSDHAFL